MITRDSLKEVMDSITKEDIDTVMQSTKDYCLLWVHIFNTGCTVSLDSFDYDEDKAQEAADNGQLFIDIDDLFRLFDESGSTNEYFIPYL